MPTPLELREQYFNISVDIEIDDKIAMLCHVERMKVRLNRYFMMNWTVGSSQMTHFSTVSAGSTKDMFFRLHKDHISWAAMGKGAPDDYGLALEWAVYSGRIKNPSQPAIQKYFDDNMGIDCSGFATNYLIASGKLKDGPKVRGGTSAASYYYSGTPVNDSSDVRQGDLLVEMNSVGDGPETGPGHVMVVQAFSAQCSGEFPLGNIRVVESTSAKHAKPPLTVKLSDSIYTIEEIIEKGGHAKAHHKKGPPAPCMILVTKRLGNSGFKVCVRRV